MSEEREKDAETEGGTATPGFADAVIERPESLGASRPTVSLHLLVKNGESVVGRLLENVGPYVDEVVAVLNDCEDGTEGVLEAWGREPGRTVDLVRVTRESHPDLYIMDEAETYDCGRPLAGERFEGPFTGKKILADWATARNLGWRRCTKDWRLFLDADDVVLDPERIPGLCKVLGEHGVDVACSLYHFHVDVEGRPLGSSFRERLARGAAKQVRWAYPVHEVLVGDNKRSHVEGSLLVQDLRDNRGKDVRIPGRGFKVLYQYARARDWAVSPRILVNLIMEVRLLVQSGAPLVSFMQSLLDTYLARSTWPEERAWAIAMVGEMLERDDAFEDASKLYRASLAEHPGSKTAFRLARVRFKAEDWRGCVEAHALGVENRGARQVLDDGEALGVAGEILVAAAWDELGEKEKARAACDAAIAAYPKNVPLKELREKIG